jgi:hypothetical protein
VCLVRHELGAEGLDHGEVVFEVGAGVVSGSKVGDWRLTLVR